MKNKYKDILKSLQLEKKKQRKDWYKQIGFGEYDEARFKTKLQQKFLAFEKEKQIKEQRENQAKMEKRIKAEKYAKFVKEMHWPKISKLK